MGLVGKSAPSAVVGLDIGTDSIKVTEAKLGKKGIQITGLGIAPTPPGAIDNNIVIDPQLLGAAIKKLLRDSKIKAKHVVSTIVGQTSVVVRVIEVPKMTREELAETMKWEVERHVPFSPSEIMMDFAPIERSSEQPDAQNMEVLLAVAQQGAVDTHVQTLFAAGLEPVAIDVQPLALSRALIDVAKQDLPQTTAVINIGATSTDVGIFEGDVLVFPGPPLPVAGVNLTNAISEALGVTEEEAEMLKKQYAEPYLPQLEAASEPVDAGYDLGQEPTGSESAFDLEAGAPEGEDYGQPASFDTSFGQSESAGEPAPYDLSSGQTASDFSPFDFGAAPGSQDPPAEERASPLQDDVFDLGVGEEVTDFKPVFDLDEPETGPVEAEARPVVDFDLEEEADQSEPAQQVEMLEAEPMVELEGDQGTDVPASPEQNVRSAVVDAVTPVLAELATEIRRSLDYYTTRYQNRPEQIFLCGGTAKIPNLDRFLEAELGVPVRVADPVANLSVKSPSCTPEYLSEVSALFPVSVGLAIREMLE